MAMTTPAQDVEAVFRELAEMKDDDPRLIAVRGKRLESSVAISIVSDRPGEGGAGGEAEPEDPETAASWVKVAEIVGAAVAGAIAGRLLGGGGGTTVCTTTSSTSSSTVKNADGSSTTTTTTTTSRSCAIE